MQKDNISEILKVALAYYNVKITKISIQESVKSHYGHPSMLSITDSLKRWKISHLALKLTIDEILEVKEPFIAHLNTKRGPEFVFVKKFEENQDVEYYNNTNSSKTINFEDFVKQYSGVSLFLEPDEHSGEYNYKTKKQNEIIDRLIPYYGLPTLLILVLFLFLRNFPFSLVTYAILVTDSFGGYMSYLLIRKDLKFYSSVSDFLCGLSTKTNCNDILGKKVSKIFGWIGWSEFGLIYFLTNFFTLLLLPTTATLLVLRVISFLSMAYVIYSISYQAFVEKRWCTLCLLVQLTLIVQFGILIGLQGEYRSILDSVLHYCIVGLLAISIIVVKGFILKRFKLADINTKYLAYKRNPLVTKTILQNAKKISPQNLDHAIAIGENDLKISITACISLHCNPCRPAFDVLFDLYKNKKVRLKLVFVLKEGDYGPISKLIYMAKNNRHLEFMQTLKTWYDSDRAKQNIMINQHEENIKVAEYNRFKESQQALIEQLEIKGTPALRINGYVPPDQRDLEEFVDLVDSIFINEIDLE